MINSFVHIAACVPLLLAVMLAAPAPLGAQTAPAVDLLLPTQLRAGYETRAWVREQLPAAGGSLSDLDRIDCIWLTALDAADGDVGDALLAALIATFKHRSVPFTFGVSVPLTIEGPRDFARRVSRLPRHIYADAPEADDRDKLQHFFASAWLAWRLDGPELADLIGLGVELGEDAFVRGGANDPRDVRTNRLGQLYAELLRTHPTALPGDVFRAWNRRWASMSER